MKRKALALTIIIVIALVLAAVVYGVQITLNSNPPSNPKPSSSSPLTSPAISIYVPDNYSTIQQAIDSASPGSAIFVRSGDYNVSVTVNKAVWLIGENRQAKIDAHSVGPDLLICHSDVNITGFDLTNTPTPGSGGPWWMPGYVYPIQLPAIQVKNSQNCNIYGNKITYSSSAVTLEASSEISVFGNEVCGCGFEITNSANNKVVNNSLVGGGTGINLYASAGNILINNTIKDMACGIWLDSSSGNTFRDNNLTNNYRSFGVTGYNLAAYDNDMDASNTIEGKPIYYWVGRANEVVPSDGACVVLVNCTGMTVQNSVLSLGFGGLVLANTNSSIVQGNTLVAQNPALLAKYATPGNPLDIMLYHSYDNQVRNNCATVWLNWSDSNIVTQNTGVIRLTDSNYNQIRGNSIHKVAFVGYDWSGVTLRYSAYNLISENSITSNSAGVWLAAGARNNRIENNIIDSNAQGGVVLSGGPSSESNLIFNNTITGNGNEGILDSAFNTTILCNNIIKNGGMGIELNDAESSNITGNVIEGFMFGGMGPNSRDCTIVANNITINSKYGQYNVWFQSNCPGVFYHNNFLTIISFYNSPSVTHIWDNGSEGNYWLFYIGTDSNGDGVGDTPYIINQNNIDRYPLMKPFDISTVIPATPP